MIVLEDIRVGVRGVDERCGDIVRFDIPYHCSQPPLPPGNLQEATALRGHGELTLRFGGAVRDILVRGKVVQCRIDQMLDLRLDARVDGRFGLCELGCCRSRRRTGAFEVAQICSQPSSSPASSEGETERGNVQFPSR